MRFPHNNVDIRHFHLFSGLGGGAMGFNNGEARVGNLQARFRCIGGVDVDPDAIRDFERLAGTPGTVLDLFSREQYKAFHGCEPPASWQEATPADIRRAAGNERPHIVFTSSPCKGLSGLLSEQKAQTGKYQALNQLTLRGVWLTLEAWSDDPPEFILFENVPRIQNRGRALLDQICELLQRHGYAVAETVHDCGELGGLAQSRRRFLLVARHQEKVPPFLYEPMKQPLRNVGQVLEKLPLPGDEAAGPMHRIPQLHWKTWVRLAFVEAGKDWRSLQDLRVRDGVLADYLIVPERTMSAGGLSSSAFAVVDPRRPKGSAEYHQYGVIPWSGTASTVTGQRSPGQGRFSVADPRLDWHQAASRNKFRVIPFDRPAGTVIGARGPADGAGMVADPRMSWGSKRSHYQSAGHFGVVPWDTATGAITGRAKHDTGRWCVADPRTQSGTENLLAHALPTQNCRGTFIIRALDSTWHRPFTTLELAALQGLVDPEELFLLAGRSDAAWRERIGNAVPAPSAAAIASVMGQALLLAWAGETFVLNAMPIWVRPLAVAAAVDAPRYA